MWVTELTKSGVFHSTVLYRLCDVYIMLNEDCKSVTYLDNISIINIFISMYGYYVYV
jgi:hypothetical protein